MKTGENIRKIRELKGIKQEDLANALGITQTAYSKIERNETELTLTRLSQIAKKLQVKEEDILFWDPETVFRPGGFNNIQHPEGNNFRFTYSDKTLYDKLIDSKDQEISTLKKSIQYLENKITLLKKIQSS